VKVTPSSKVVGDMALFMVTNNLKPADVGDPQRHLAFPRSVVEFFRGDIGQPAGGFPKDLQKVILGKEKPLKGRPGATLPKVNMEKTREELAEKTRHDVDETDLASYLLYPQVFLDFDRFRGHYGDVPIPMGW
jgi:pyruvate carboxylase